VTTVGVGASAGVTAEEVLAAVDAVLPPGAADVRLATLAARAAEPGLAEAAARRGWPLVGHDAATLAAVAVPSRVTIGAHTVSHSYLGALPADEQARDMVDAKRVLEAIVRKPVRHFSYPHGDHEPETIACVRAAGFEAACGSDAEPVVGPVDRFDLPRIEVPNFGGAAFARWLDEWGG